MTKKWISGALVCILILSMFFMTPAAADTTSYERLHALSTRTEEELQAYAETFYWDRVLSTLEFTADDPKFLDPKVTLEDLRQVNNFEIFPCYNIDYRRRHTGSVEDLLRDVYDMDYWYVIAKRDDKIIACYTIGWLEGKFRVRITSGTYEARQLTHYIERLGATNANETVMLQYFLTMFMVNAKDEVVYIDPREHMPEQLATMEDLARTVGVLEDSFWEGESYGDASILYHSKILLNTKEMLYALFVGLGIVTLGTGVFFLLRRMKVRRAWLLFHIH